jgi:hypothetical protein
VRVERLVHTNLVRHFRILTLQSALSRRDPKFRTSTAPERLLRGLLADKARQSLGRAFLLLKVAHRRENIQRVYLACMSKDPYARANAAEFLDARLRYRDQASLRALLRLIADDLSLEERVMRARSLLPYPIVSSQDEALTALIDDQDVTVAGLAALQALEARDEDLPLSVRRARHRRPELELGALLQESVSFKEQAVV